MAVNHVHNNRTLTGGVLDTVTPVTDKLEEGKVSQLLELILIELRSMNLLNNTEDKLEDLRNDISKEI